MKLPQHIVEMIDEVEYIIHHLRDPDLETNVSGKLHIKTGEIVIAISDYLAPPTPNDHVYWR